MNKARPRALLDQERRRLEQLGRAVARDHDDAVAVSRPEDQVEGADRRVTEETSHALSKRHPIAAAGPVNTPVSR